MVKLLPRIDLICCLILLSVICIKGLPWPGLHTDNLLPCTSLKINDAEVYFNNLARIVILDGYAKVDCYGQKIASITGGFSILEMASITGEFGILEINPNSVHLNLSSVSNKSVISVFTNNTDVEVELQTQDRLLIAPIRRENHWGAGHEDYEVRLRSTKGLEDKIIISTAINGRKVKIDVNYEPNKTRTISFASAILIILLCFVLKCSARMSETRVQRIEAFSQDGPMIKKCV